MTKWFSRAILAVFVISLVGLVVVTTFLGASQSKNRLVHRTNSLAEIMQALKYQTELHKNYLPMGISYEWQQIGTASDGCQLSTNACQITAASCLDLNPILRDVKQLSLPADIKDGNLARTGFAIKFEEPDKVWIAACGSEALADLKISQQFPGVIFNQEYSEATMEAELATPSAAPVRKSNEK